MEDIENKIFMLSEVQESVNYMIENNGKEGVDEWEYITDFKRSTIREFENLSGLLDRSLVYLECIKSLMSGGVDEEEFVNNLKGDLKDLKYKL